MLTLPSKGQRGVDAGAEEVVARRWDDNREERQGKRWRTRSKVQAVEDGD